MFFLSKRKQSIFLFLSKDESEAETLQTHTTDTEALRTTSAEPTLAKIQEDVEPPEEPMSNEQEAAGEKTEAAEEVAEPAADEANNNSNNNADATGAE